MWQVFTPLPSTSCDDGGGQRGAGAGLITTKGWNGSEEGACRGRGGGGGGGARPSMYVAIYHMPSPGPLLLILLLLLLLLRPDW